MSRDESPPQDLNRGTCIRRIPNETLDGPLAYRTAFGSPFRTSESVPSGGRFRFFSILNPCMVAVEWLAVDVGNQVLIDVDPW